MKEYVKSKNFTSTTEIMNAMNEMFRDVLQQVMETELEMELGSEKKQKVVFITQINEIIGIDVSIISFFF